MDDEQQEDDEDCDVRIDGNKVLEYIDVVNPSTFLGTRHIERRTVIHFIFQITFKQNKSSIQYR